MYKSTDPIADIERQDKIEQLRTEEATQAETEAIAREKRRMSFGRKLVRFFGWILLIALLTGGAAAGLWYFLLKDDMPAAGTDGVGGKNRQSQTLPPPTPPATTTAPVETYNSTGLQLQFDYPKGWKVTEDNKVTAISPPMQLKTTSGNSAGLAQPGEIVLTIRPTQTSLTEFKDGNASASLASEKINYAKPSQGQRASTYISFLSYAPSSSSAVSGAAAKGLDGVYVTGDNGYQLNQAIPLVDVAKANPLITVTFQACPEATCAANSARQPLTLAAASWKDEKIAKPVKAMLQSLVVK